MSTDELINVIQHGNGVRAAVAKLKLRSEIAVLELENESMRAEIYNAKGMEALANLQAESQAMGLYERGQK